jgi:hypothetical protein
MNQDDYIIRIYRRDRQNPRMVVGTVEQVGEKLKMGFTDFEELRVILGVPRGRSQRGEELMDHASSTAYSAVTLPFGRGKKVEEDAFDER